MIVILVIEKVIVAIHRVTLLLCLNQLPKEKIDPLIDQSTLPSIAKILPNGQNDPSSHDDNLDRQINASKDQNDYSSIDQNYSLKGVVTSIFPNV